MSAWFIFLVVAMTCIATRRAVADGRAEAGITSSPGGVRTTTYAVWDVNWILRFKACAKPLAKQNPGITVRDLNRPTWNPGKGANPFSTQFAAYEAAAQPQHQSYHLSRPMVLEAIPAADESARAARSGANLQMDAPLQQ